LWPRAVPRPLSLLTSAFVISGCLARPQAAPADNTDPDPQGPISVGQGELASVGATAVPTLVITSADAQAASALQASRVKLDPRPGSFVVVPSNGKLVIVGSDDAGAMYGAFEVAERRRLDGDAATFAAAPFAAAPALPVRGANLFLVLPERGEQSWWLRDMSFWRAYLDMLARARINFLDLHGMYNPDNTIFPNALLYFARSPSFPDVGVPEADRARNLSVLAKVIKMAKARGIDVGLMTYNTDTSPLGDGKGPHLTERQLHVYTHEAAEDLARHLTGLKRLGFRIGESGHVGAWYAQTLIAGVKASGAPVEIYTRTWGSSKPEVLALIAAAGGQPIIEAKLNGEQWGAPYPIAGGIFVQDRWTVYSYEDYLNDATPPYRFVFQLRTGGTHRAFRQASYARAQRTVQSLLQGAPVSGFSLEAAHAYEPQHDFMHATHDRFSPWTFRRDELMYQLFGRLGYDPATPERVFRHLFERRVGTDKLWEPMQAASDIVPWIQTAHTCGPDHRDFAPELELGGPIDYWATPSDAPSPAFGCRSYVHTGHVYHGPFDSFAVAGPYEFARDLVSGTATARLTPAEVAKRVLADAATARTAGRLSLDSGNGEARDVARECLALADLGDYFAHKLRGASALAVYAATGAGDYLEAARTESLAATNGWIALARDTEYIAPWHEPLRMSFIGIDPYHWNELVPQLDDDEAGIARVVKAVQANQHLRSGAGLPPVGAWLDTPRAAPPAVTRFSPVAGASSTTVTVEAAVIAGTQLTLWYKPFSGNADWSMVAMSRNSDGTFSATVDSGARDGGLFSVEIRNGNNAWRYPDITAATPYVTLAPR
jgi:hypothetical protein